MQIERIVWIVIAAAGTLALTIGLVRASWLWSQAPFLQWVLLGLFGGVGIFALGAGLLWTARIHRLTTSGKAAQGALVGQRSASSTIYFKHGEDVGEFGGTKFSSTYVNFFPIVEFRTEQGQTVRVEGGTDVAKSDKTGTPVAVFYDPAKPSDAVIADFRQAWLGPLVVSAAGLVFLVCGLAGFAAIRRGVAAAAAAARSPEAVEAQLERDRGASGRYTVAVKGTIVRVQKLDVSGPPLYVYICKGRRPGKSADEEFQTDFFPFELDAGFAGRSVDILLDPDDATAYYVPSGALMKEIVSRERKRADGP